MAVGQGLRRVVVVGASMAGLRAAERLRAKGFDGALTVIGAEPHLPYDRPPLSKQFLAGEAGMDKLALHGVSELAADWVLGTAVTGLDLSERRVTTATADAYPFDGLVIATGSHPRQLRNLDLGKPGIYALRTVDDARALHDALAASPRRVLIVGGGFIGVEVASTCRKLGLDVTIVTLDPPLVVAGPLVSGVCTEMLVDHGVDVRVGLTVARTRGADRVEGVVLVDGSEVAADVVVVAVGAVPTTEWLEGSGVMLSNGVVCDASCAVAGVPAVVAAGDVARWPNPRFGSVPMRIEHWTNAVEQGTAAAVTLLEGSGPHTAFSSVPLFWSDHFDGRVQSIGLPNLADRWEIVEGTVESRKFAAALYRDDRLIAAIGYNSPRAIVQYRGKLLRENADVGAL